MDTLIGITQFIADNIFGQPALLIGMIALIGLLLQRKSSSEVISGSVKTVVGFLILTKGADIVVDALLKFTPILQSAFGMEASLFDAFAGVGLGALTANYGGVAALIMTFGFLLNVLIARFTKAKYIYLTGHLLWWIALVLVAVQLEVNPNAGHSSPPLPRNLCG